MSNQKHTVSTDALDTLGTIIDERAARDAIHLAVEPVIAGEYLYAGAKIVIREGVAMNPVGQEKSIGIVDPFLVSRVKPGERFWLVVNPRTITSLRHVWSHPAFGDAKEAPVYSTSEEWMRAWARVHFMDSYDGFTTEDQAYAFALEAGEEHYIGSFEDARDHIDDEWWGHWENITGLKGERDSYFSCSC